MKKRTLLLFILSAFALQAQDNWFEAQSNRATVKSIVSTSELVEGQYDGKYLYPPVNLLDGDFSTTWCEADEGSSGLGESITLELEEPISFDEIQVVNGFAHGNDYYHKNNRVAILTLTQTAGEHFQQKQYTLKDDREGWQSISFDLLQTAQILNFRIDEVYQGFKYDDTCFSDIRFLRDGQVIPFENVARIKTAQEDHSRALLQEESGSFIEQIKALAAAGGDRRAIFLVREGADEGLAFTFNRSEDFSNEKLNLKVDSFQLHDINNTDFRFQYLPNSYYSTSAAERNFSSREEFLNAMGENNHFIVIPTSWERNKKTTLKNYSLITNRQVDYIETETIELLKLDGDKGLYINDIYYNRINEDDYVILMEEGP
jgi:hypothetical protein